MTTFVVGNFSLVQNSFCWTGGEVQAETQGLWGRVGQGACVVQAGIIIASFYCFLLLLLNLGYLSFYDFSVRDLHKAVGRG